MNLKIKKTIGCSVLFLIGFCAFFILLSYFSINTPPLYEVGAEKFLQKEKVDPNLIEKLNEIKPLTESEAIQLSKYDNIAVLLMLARNPSIPKSLLQKLSKHKNEEVRWGVAYNKNTPLEVLLSYRTKGVYTIMNDCIAQNPKISQKMLLEMYRHDEASLTGIAENPNCPVELMKIILEKGDELEKATLARNPNITDDMVQKLAKEKSVMIKSGLYSNPRLNPNLL